MTDAASTTAWPSEELRSLFPLPLTPFELLMLHGERPDFPMNFQMRLAFRGRLAPDSWQRAVDTAIRRHPLLLSRVERSASGIWQWSLPTNTVPTLDLSGHDPEAEHLPEAVDPHAGECLKMWGRVEDERALVTLFFHHACSDGMGALAFLRDLFECYTADRQGRASILPPQDFARWHSRGDLRPSPQPGTPVQPREELGEVYRFLFRRPQRLVDPRWFSSISGKESPCLVREAPELKTLASSAKAAGVTMNDLLLRDLFLACRDWRERSRGKRFHGWLRLSIPTDQRSAHDVTMPGANKIGFAFVTRRENDLADPSALLTGIRDETLSIKEHGHGALFVNFLALAQRTGLSRFFSGDRSMGTAILSNLGQVSRHLAGQLPVEDGRVRLADLVLDNYVAVPPARPGTGVFIVVGTYADRLSLAMRSDPRILDRPALAEFMNLYLDRLRHSAG